MSAVAILVIAWSAIGIIFFIKWMRDLDSQVNLIQKVADNVNELPDVQTNGWTVNSVLICKRAIRLGQLLRAIVFGPAAVIWIICNWKDANKIKIDVSFGKGGDTKIAL